MRIVYETSILTAYVTLTVVLDIINCLWICCWNHWLDWLRAAEAQDATLVPVNDLQTADLLDLPWGVYSVLCG